MAYFPSNYKHQLYNNLFRITWKNSGSHMRVLTVLPYRFKHRTIRGRGGLGTETEGGWETGIGLLNLRYWTNIKNTVLSLFLKKNLQLKFHLFRSFQGWNTSEYRNTKYGTTVLPVKLSPRILKKNFPLN